ncbi:STAS domain-containing protein [Nevskia ramosa]|uniref:STAS domain-containing protein n=1 Tax=Nevskia ramosa TaxID=64002 RepID=UPI0023577F03
MTASMQVDGALDFKHVPQWLDKAKELAAAGELDLAGVTRADSAGLALLLELTRRAQALGKPLQLRNPPAQLVELSRFFGLDTLLRFTDR